MAGYAHLYRSLLEDQKKVKQRLLIADDLVQSFREFLDAKGLHREFVEFLLVRCVGENRAREIMTEEQASHQQLSQEK